MSLLGTVWEPIGPSPLAEGATLKANGQVTAIAVNPNNPNIMFAGAAWGGIWRTHDGGNHWTPIFDHAPSLGIGEPGALAIDQVDTNIIYAGTSSREGSQFSGLASTTPTQPQAGLFKSIDGGASWIQLGSGYPTGNDGNAFQFVNQLINVVVVEPTNNQIVYLASSSGFFRSTDGGLNWTPGNGASGDARSLVLDTSSPSGSRVLYCGISGQGVFQSTDGGQSWTNILNASTTAVANALCPAPPCNPARTIGKCIVALAPPTSPANPAGVQVLYVAIQGLPRNRPSLPTDAPDPVGVFMSTDQGSSWNTQAAGAAFNATVSWTQWGYSFHFAVDPASPGDGINDIVYLGTINQYISTNSGVAFTSISTPAIHADTHTWAFVKQAPPVPSTVFCGNDGGLFKSTDHGATWTPLNAGGVQTCLFYNFDVKPDATASVTVGALQDNSVVTNSGGWSSAGGAGGDGWCVAYDGQIAHKVYSTS